MASQVLPQVVNIIGGESVPSHDGEVASKVDKESQQVARRRAGREYTDIGIDGAGRLDDVRVVFPGVCDLPAVAHEKPAVEADAGLVPDPITERSSVERAKG